MKTKLKAVQVYAEIPVTEINRVNRLLDGPAEGYEDDIIAELVVPLPGGMEMLIQAVGCTDEQDGAWTQGVLFKRDEGGLLIEVGTTDIGEDFDGEYSVEHDGTTYSVFVRPEP